MPPLTVDRSAEHGPQNVFTGNKGNASISINGATGQAIDPVTLAVDNLIIGDAT